MTMVKTSKSQKFAGKKGQHLVSTKSKLNDTNLILKNMAQDLKQKEVKFKFMKTKETQVNSTQNSNKPINNTYLIYINLSVNKANIWYIQSFYSI